MGNRESDWGWENRLDLAGALLLLPALTIPDSRFPIPGPPDNAALPQKRGKRHIGALNSPP